MFGAIRRYFADLRAHAHSQQAAASVQKARRLQEKYWRPRPSERDELLRMFPGALTWRKLLRLHHLLCMDLLEEPGAALQLQRGRLDEAYVPPPGPTLDRVQETAQLLLGPESPYRPRHASLWLTERAEPEDVLEPRDAPRDRAADLEGRFLNVSLTHLGALEVLRPDSRREPGEIDFISFDDLQGAHFAPPALYRAGRLYQEYGKGDLALWTPLLYGPTFRMPQGPFREGRMTGFLCHVPLQVEAASMSLGIGVGQQGFLLQPRAATQVRSGRGKQKAAGGAGKSAKKSAQAGKSGQSAGDQARIVGLGALEQLNTGLELGDAHFPEKARGRGLDPEEIRRSGR